MKNAISIFIFTALVTAFYNYVGQLVPQKEVHPPKSADISADMDEGQMVEAGRIIVEGKGTCLTCHNGSARFPVLDGIGSRAATTRDGMSDVEYLAEALYDPNTFIVEPYAPGMPAVNKPPIGLNDQEILTVIAYLQSLGGEVTVDMSTKLKYQGEAGPAASAATPSEEETSEAPAEELDGAGIFAKYGCAACHAVDAPTRLVGPSLYDLGARQNKGEIYESVVDPDVKLVEGFPPGVMGATLGANGFYEKTSPAQLKMLVDYLAELKGGE